MFLAVAVRRIDAKDIRTRLDQFDKLVGLPAGWSHGGDNFRTGCIQRRSRHGTFVGANWRIGLVQWPVAGDEFKALPCKMRGYWISPLSTAAFLNNNSRPMESDPHPVALITGGSAGLGWVVAHTFLDAGYRVMIAGRNQDRLEPAIERFAAPADRSARDHLRFDEERRC